MSAPLPSTLPTVKAWLFTQLTAVLTASPGKTLDVLYGGSAPTNGDDVVTLRTGARRVFPHVPTGDMGAVAWRESYDLDITVETYRPEGFQSCEERAWALVASIENTIRATLWGIIGGGTAVATLGGNVFNLVIGDQAATSVWADTDDGPVTTITYPLTLHATI